MASDISSYRVFQAFRRKHNMRYKNWCLKCESRSAHVHMARMSVNIGRDEVFSENQSIRMPRTASGKTKVVVDQIWRLFVPFHRLNRVSNLVSAPLLHGTRVLRS